MRIEIIIMHQKIEIIIPLQIIPKLGIQIIMIIQIILIQDIII